MIWNQIYLTMVPGISVSVTRLPCEGGPVGSAPTLGTNLLRILSKEVKTYQNSRPATQTFRGSSQSTQIQLYYYNLAMSFLLARDL